MEHSIPRKKNGIFWYYFFHEEILQYKESSLCPSLREHPFGRRRSRTNERSIDTGTGFAETTRLLNAALQKRRDAIDCPLAHGAHIIFREKREIERFSNPETSVKLTEVVNRSLHDAERDSQ
jgi:hypothetical protein